MSLYDLSKNVELVVQEVISAEGELSPDLEKRLDEISLQFKDKSSNIAKWTMNIDSNVEAIEGEIERLKRRAQVQKNLKKRLMDYLKFCLETAGLNKVDFPTFTVSIQRNPPSVEIDNEEVIPAKYIRIEQQKVIDKKSILADSKSGDNIPGTHLVTDKTHLRIK